MTELKGFDLQANRLALAGSRLNDIAAEMAADLKTLQSTLDGIAAGSPPWGNDEPGKAFASKYLPRRDNVFQALGTYEQQLATAGKALMPIADNYEQTDIASAKAIREQQKVG